MSVPAVQVIQRRIEQVLSHHELYEMLLKGVVILPFQKLVKDQFVELGRL